jgi:hypothetical protein
MAKAAEVIRGSLTLPHRNIIFTSFINFTCKTTILYAQLASAQLAIGSLSRIREDVLLFIYPHIYPSQRPQEYSLRVRSTICLYYQLDSVAVHVYFSFCVL